MYQPLSLNSRPRRKRQTSLGPQKGINNLFPAQLLNTEYAQRITNYHILGPMNLEKRKGFEVTKDFLLSLGLDSAIRYDDDNWLISYGTTVARYTASTDTVDVRKNDFSVSSFDLKLFKYGKHVLICNGEDRIHRMDGLYAISEISNAPRAKGVTFIDARAFAYGIKDDLSSIIYSEKDTGSNPPFDVWSVTDVATAGGKLTDRSIGEIKATEGIGENNSATTIVVGGEFGKFAFYINQIDVSGVVSKQDVVVMNREDAGMAPNAKSTSQGIVYGNSQGIWLLAQVTPSSQTGKDIEANITEILGPRYFDDVNLDNMSVVENGQRKEIYISIAKGAQSNNTILVYNYGQKAISVFTGWTVKEFTEYQGAIFAIDSGVSQIQELFKGHDDGGSSIGTALDMEIPLGAFEEIANIRRMSMYGHLSSSTLINIYIDKYNKKAEFRKNVKTLCWGYSGAGRGGGGFNESAYNESAFNEGYSLPGTNEDFAQANVKINNVQRLKLRIRENSKVPHALGYIIANYRAKTTVKKNNLTVK